MQGQPGRARLALHHSSNLRRLRRREAAEAKRENGIALIETDEPAPFFTAFLPSQSILSKEKRQGYLLSQGVSVLEYHELFFGDHYHAPRVIVMMVRDARIGSFLVRILRREARYYPILVTHKRQVFKVIRQVKPDLIILDDDLTGTEGLELSRQLHDIQGLERVPTIVSNLSARFPCSLQKQADLKEYDEPSAVESFFYTIQEVLT